MAESYDFKVAYSNEAFELWYILHFEYLTAGINRDKYKEKLTQYLGKEYKKNSSEMYNVLLKHQGVAIRNAKKLCQFHGNSIPADSNPLTTVYMLVEELNDLMKSHLIKS